MAIAAMILGIISLVVWLLLRAIPLSSSMPLGDISVLFISLPVAFVGLILGIVTLIKYKVNRRMAVTGLVICALGIIVSTGSWLLTEPAADWGPAWSPDGSRIVFTSIRDRNDEIYVMDADGSNLTNRTNSPTGETFPVWSP